MKISPTAVIGLPVAAQKLSCQTPGTLSLGLKAPQQDTLRFQGSFAGPAQSVTVKLPKRVGEQLDFLSKTLGLPAAEIATTAAYLVTHATDSGGFGNKRSVGLVPASALATFKSESSSVTTGEKPSEAPGYKLYSTFNMTMGDWKTWKKANVQDLFLSRGVVKKVKDLFSSKKPFTYKFQSTEAAGGAALWTFAAIAVPGMQVLLPFTLPTLLVEGGRKRRDLYNGVNMLCEAVKAKQANPSLELVSISLDTRDMENNKPVIFITAEKGLFRNLKASQP